MAGGLGTRMKSAIPKHFPRDPRPAGWSTGSSRQDATRRRPARRDRVARRTRRVRRQRRRGRDPGDAARHRRPVRSARTRSKRTTATSSSSPRHAAAHVRAAAGTSSTRTIAKAPTRPSSAPKPPTRASTDAWCETGTAPCRRSSRDRRERRGAEDPRDQLVDLRLPLDGALAGARAGLQPRTCRGAVPHRCDRDHRRRRGKGSPRTSQPTRGRPDGVNNARRARARRRGSCATGSTSATCSRAVTIVDPKTTWIERRSRSTQDVTIHPFTSCVARRKSRPGPEIGANTVRSTLTSTNATNRPFCYLSPGTVLGESSKAGALRGSKLTHRRPHPRCPTSRTSATGRSATTRNVGAGAITANFPATSRARPRAGRTIGSNVRDRVIPQWLRGAGRNRGRSMDCSRIGDTKMSRGCAAISRSRQENKDGLCGPCSATP